MLLAALAGFNTLVYLYSSICLNGIDWRNFTLASVNIRYAVCCEVLRWVSTQ